MYFFTGWMSDGVPFLRIDTGRLERQMLASEMLDEIYQIQKDSGERVSNVVVMGTGNRWTISMPLCG